VIGHLLAAPPQKGALKDALEELASRTWTDPVSEEPRRFGFKTLERWYYQALSSEHDPVAALRRQPRGDRGRQVAVSGEIAERLEVLWRAHPDWTMQLLHDNLIASLAEDGKDERPSYSSVRRYLRGRGFVRVPRRKARVRSHHGRETRSFEADRVGALWHLDFHVGSRRVIDETGRWRTVKLLGVLDDHSRLCCHAQWYLAEGVDEIVHGFRQALQKRGLPRALMSDNGPAMVAEEFRQGLLKLGILHQTTLPYHPEQNGKQERFFGTLEGRLMAMLAEKADLTLRFLNEATQAWAEMEYNRSMQSEIGTTPLERFTSAKDASRACPESSDLAFAFMREVRRRQKKGTHTVSVLGTRLEIPQAFRHLPDILVRFASWDLSCAWMVDERTGEPVIRLFPEDRVGNADGRRRVLGEVDAAESGGEPDDVLPPLMRQLLRDYSADGRPFAFIPKPSDERDES